MKIDLMASADRCPFDECDAGANQAPLDAVLKSVVVVLNPAGVLGPQTELLSSNTDRRRKDGDIASRTPPVIVHVYPKPGYRPIAHLTVQFHSL